MSRFLEALHSGPVLLMDGAMGTELQRAGIAEGECYERWNLTHPEQVRAIHRAYLCAGARCLLTNTFQANPHALARHGLQDEVENISQAAITLARSVCGVEHFVLASIGPFAPDDPQALESVLPALRWADGLLFETWSDSRALLTAARACRSALNPPDLPVLLSITFRRGIVPGTFHTQDGLEPETVAQRAHGSRLAALGVNCGRDIGMDEIVAIVRRYRQATELPLFARPNAGTPTQLGQRWVYPQTPEAMAARLPELLAVGIRLVGGCCGTTPEHIASFRPVIDDWNARHGACEDRAQKEPKQTG